MQNYLIGIDPGLKSTGFAILSRHHEMIKLVDCGSIKPSASKPLPLKLAFLHTRLHEIFSIYPSQTVSIEKIFVNHNAASSLTLGFARGTLLTLCGLFNAQVSEYAPNTIKKTITGFGHASKEQLFLMMTKMLDLSTKIKEIDTDASDAIAIALCHFYHETSLHQKIKTSKTVP